MIENRMRLTPQKLLRMCQNAQFQTLSCNFSSGTVLRRPSTYSRLVPAIQPKPNDTPLQSN